jgi:hypothetical protein
MLMASSTEEAEMPGERAHNEDRMIRELARRTNGGIEVALFWDMTSGELTVCVADEPSDSYFELCPAPDQALDCFYHPYAYAGVDTLAEPELLPA